MQGDANKEVIRTCAVDGHEVTVRGSRYDPVKMMPPVDGTATDPDPFDESIADGKPFTPIEALLMRLDSPNLTIIDSREIRDGEKAGAWMESGWPEQTDTYDR